MNNKTTVKIGVFALAMLNVGAVMSLRGLPMMAKEGLSMIFYLLFASLLFLVPVSLVSAELATGWPRAGGVYRWVREAYGSGFGFTAIWAAMDSKRHLVPDSLNFCCRVSFIYVY